MDVRQLRYFVAVAGEGSISRAAARLGVAQPAVSRQVAALEAAAGVSLFLRHGRGVQLTEAGAELLERAERVLAELGEAERALEIRRSAPGGVAAIGMTHAQAAQLAPRLVRAFRARHPDVLVRIMEGFADYLRFHLTRGTIHAALIYDPPATKEFQSEPILRQDLCLMGRPGLPMLDRASVTLSELAGLPLVLPRAEHSLRRVIEKAVRGREMRLDVVVESESAGSMRALMIGEGLYSMLARSSLRQDVEDGTLLAVPIVAPSVRRTLCITTAPWAPLSPPARHLIEIARRELLALVREGEIPAEEGG